MDPLDARVPSAPPAPRGPEGRAPLGPAGASAEQGAGRIPVPESILAQLGSVRRWQTMVRLTWGLARGAAVVAGSLFVAGLVDWVIDLRMETPLVLRATLLVAQGVLWSLAATFFVIRPLLDRPSDRELALWVEEKFPEFGHRLITAVELNRAGAPTAGMSLELLAAVTREAGERAARTTFTSRIDRSPVRRGAAMMAAVGALALVLGIAAPQTTAVLLAREFLATREIPRSVAIEALLGSQVSPSGEELKLFYRATGRGVSPSLRGRVRVLPEGRPGEEYPLVYESAAPEGGALFSAAIPPGSVNFDYQAWLRDGRSRKIASVVYEPRPVVQKIDAWVILPRYCGVRPDGTPYEQYRVRGEIAGPLGCTARVVAEVQKPVRKGVLELLGRTGGEGAKEAVVRRIDLVPDLGRKKVEGSFDLRSGETSYRIVVEDRNGFANATPPKRGIGIIPEEPPRVLLLPERLSLPGSLGTAEDSELDGMPIPQGSVIRIAYTCTHPYGLGRAQLAYRIMKAAKTTEDADPAAANIPWRILPLSEVRATPEVGSFDLRRGRFEKTGFRDQVEFYPMPSADPEHVFGRVEGGGSFDFQTRPLSDLQPGDQVELRVEVFAKNPGLSSPGRSEVRVKGIVTRSQFMDWVLETLRHESRIRQLESRQQSVFAPSGDK